LKEIVGLKLFGDSPPNLEVGSAELSSSHNFDEYNWYSPLLLD
jgi:hypothetical protein